MISPRDAAADRLQPSIQSAPPIPRAGTGQGMTGRFGSMALPSLPPVLGPGQSAQRVTASRVPPTPTRLSIARNPAGAGSGSLLTPTVPPISGTAAAAAAAAARSPPTASVPIASSFVPPTPASLHAPGYAGEKAAFLAPFEMFYDALADSKTLKQWLGEQLHKSQALAGQLQRQQEHLDELVGAAVERRLAGVREEVHGLRRKVEELEYALHHALSTGGSLPTAGAATGLVRTSSSGPAQTYSPGEMGAPGVAAGKGKAKANGIQPPPPPTPSHHAGVVPESYQFPPPPDGGGLRRPEPVRRALSPTQLERESESRSFPGSQAASPVPFDVGRRLSVSAIRLDPRSPAGAEPAPLSQASHRASGPGRERERERERERDRERERERERGEIVNRPGALLPPPSAAPGRPDNTTMGWSRPWSPRGTRASLPTPPTGTSATRSSLGHGHTSDRPGLVRQSSGQRGAGEGYGYASPEGAEGREKEREAEREREREREPSPVPAPPRREARSPEPMEE
ncbi:hypothetical protein BD414DRAFT_494519 [Trametes punicea]|nr:hypothetical protein BD414DRAFT_494519 [Trametes punicea]